MLRFFRYGLPAVLFILVAVPLLVGGESAPRLNEAAVQAEFKAAIQRIRQHQPDQPDSPALKSYAIYDYLLVARFRRDLEQKPGDDVDTAINAFLEAHAGEPVARNLRNDWLTTLATRRKWDWFMPRATDVNTPALICDRLQGKIAALADVPGAQGTAAVQTAVAVQAPGANVQASPDASGAAAQANATAQAIAAEALTRWSLAQKQPPECDPVFAWLRQQNVITPDLAEARTRTALAAD